MSTIILNRAFSDYCKLKSEYKLTLYPYSELLVSREPKWKEHIHVTGYWMDEGRYDRKAKELGEKLRAEDGSSKAADIPERYWESVKNNPSERF